MIEKIIVNEIDENLLKQVQASHEKLILSKEEIKELHLEINSATGGDTEIAIQVAAVLHSDASIIPVTHSSGDLGTAATILAAAGFESKRTADPKTTFTLNEAEPYGEDTKIEDLDGPDYFIFDVMSKLTGLKTIILGKIIEGGSFSSLIAKRCKIIDQITSFKSAFEALKPVVKKGRKSLASIATETKTEVSENAKNDTPATEATKVSTRTRTSTPKAVESRNVQRGRIIKNG